MTDTPQPRLVHCKKLGKELMSHLTKRPSEYFDRNCSIGAANTRRRELARRYEIGVGNIMWGNDFPHHVSTWPHSQKVIDEHFADQPADLRNKVVRDNCLAVYEFGK